MYIDLADKKLNLSLLVFGILSFWTLTLILFYLSGSPLDYADGIFHYQIARYTWTNPEQFLNHWGKPLFNILSSPFAQFGFVGMVIFNLVLFSLCSIMLYRLARHFHFLLPGLSPFILMTSVVFFEMVNAGMTEILMATLSLSSIYFVVMKRAVLGAFIASLTIVARPEAIVIIPVYGLILLLSRNWKAIPWLASGFLLFSLIGYLGFSKSFLWIINEDPYPSESPYGHGPLLHFVKNHDILYGPLLLSLLILGVVLFMIHHIRRLQKDKLSLTLLYSILCSALILMLHSILWWKGLKGSLGLTRVIATSIPLIAFVAQYAINACLKTRFKMVLAPAIIILLVFSLKQSFAKSGLPVKMTNRQLIQAEAAQWYLDQNHQGKVSYLAPFIGFKADLIPEDRSKVILLWSLNREDPSIGLKPGHIIIWDSQFGPLEGRVKEESLINNPALKIERYLEDTTEAIQPGKKPYRIYILSKK